VPEERRLVTVLFSDVVGSTALGEELDPEDLRALLTVYYAIAQEVVAEHGGTLEKFIGDAVMAVFGLPAAHGDDAPVPCRPRWRCAIGFVHTRRSESGCRSGSG